jgi:hypothetical protein
VLPHGIEADLVEELTTGSNVPSGFRSVTSRRIELVPMLMLA